MRKDYLEDIREIKDIMSRSTRFISLSGWSGISAGIIGLTGAYLAHTWIYSVPGHLSFETAQVPPETATRLLLLSLGTVILGLGAAIFFTTRRSRQRKEKIWDPTTRRLLVNFFIPLLTGGLVCLIFLEKGFIGVLPAFTLIFYGLGLVNASKYTIHEVRALGLIHIVLGLGALLWIKSSLVLWALGFGLLHILSGFLVKNRYES